MEISLILDNLRSGLRSIWMEVTIEERFLYDKYPVAESNTTASIIRNPISI